jgi:hypothetical protein
MEQLEHRIVGRDRASGLGNLAQTDVDRLNGIGGVNYFSGVVRIVKEWAQARPVAPAGLPKRHR